MLHCLFAQASACQLEFNVFAQKIKALAEEMDVDLADYEIDHIALRVNSESSARYWLTALLKCGTILADNIVNGRVIYLIKLHQPLDFLGQSVDIIELPFPKNKSYPQENWEHIEIVMPFFAQESVEQWIERIKGQFLWAQKGNLSIKVSEPKVEGERLPNPSIAVSFKDKTHNHTCIKVHPYPIKTIVEV